MNNYTVCVHLYMNAWDAVEIRVWVVDLCMNIWDATEIHVRLVMCKWQDW